MYVIDTADGTRHEVEISLVRPDDYKKIRMSKEFDFKWNQYKNEEVYKLCLKNDTAVLGLVHIIPHPEEGYQFLEVLLIESSKSNRGKMKKFDRVGGCLLAFACRQSYVRNCTGYVMLTAKTNKAVIFEKRYGFKHIGSIGVLGERMVSEPENTDIIIKEFYS